MPYRKSLPLMESPDIKDSAAPGVGILAAPSYHRIRVQHIRSMIREADRLAAQVEGIVADGQSIEIDDRRVLPIMALDRCANLLRHAAEEIMDERHAATGWPQI